MTTLPLTEQIELHRECMWRRDEKLRVESAIDAEPTDASAQGTDSIGVDEIHGSRNEIDYSTL